MKIYGDTNSGNCLKVKWVCDRLALAYSWIEVDILKGETRTHGISQAEQRPARCRRSISPTAARWRNPTHHPLPGPRQRSHPSRRL